MRTRDLLRLAATLLALEGCARGVVAEDDLSLAPTDSDAGVQAPAKDAAPFELDATPGDDAAAAPQVVPPPPRDAAIDATPHAIGDAAPDSPVDATHDAAPAPCKLLVNEVMTGVSGSAHDEFVEVYSTCSGPLDISGFSLVYRAGTNAAPIDAANDGERLYTWSAGSVIPAHAHLLYTGQDFSGPKDGLLDAGLKHGLGGVAIRDAAGHLVDALGYGAGSINPANAFIEGRAAVANAVLVAPGQSIARHPDGADTDDNAADFTPGTPTPRASN